MNLSSQEPTHLVRAPLSQGPTYLNRAPGRSLGSACECYATGQGLCYEFWQGTLKCWTFTESSCAGEWCAQAECADVHCSVCSYDGASCQTCEDGYLLVSAACEAEATFFADVSVQVLPGGVVGMASPKLHALLSAGFDGTGDRAAAV